MSRALAALAILALSGCVYWGGERLENVPFCEPGIQQAPCVSGAEHGVAYRFRLLTHCGIEWAYFDGRYWVPRPKIDAPPNWSPIERGTMTLVAVDRAVFKSDVGGEARFEPAPVSYRPPGCA